MEHEKLDPRRVFTAIMACVLALAMGASVTACSDEKQTVSNAVTSQLDSIKNPTQADVDDLLESDAEYKQLCEDYGIDTLEFIKHSFGRLEYTVDDVTVNGDMATVDLTVNNADIDTAYNNATTTVQNTDDPEILALISNGDAKGLAQKIYQLYYDEIDKVGMIGDTKITLELEKDDDGNWEVTDDSVDDFYNALAPTLYSD